MKKKLSTTEFIRKRQAGSPEEGEVIDPNEEIASGFAGGREPGRAEEAFRALVEGSQGFLGLEPGRRGSEAYRTGQALSNLPALALPAAAIKGTGKAKDALEALVKKAEAKEPKAPEIKKSGKLTQVEKELLERGGERQAKRLQRAADEIPGLEDQYQSNALIRAFLGRKGYPYQGVMTMRPGDFEKFALPLDLPLGQYSKENIENLRNVLAQGGSFEDVPFLMMDRKDNIPFIAGHEGRHRTRALQAEGQPKTLVEVYPRRGLEMGADDMPMKATEWLEKFNEALGEGRLVLPEGLDPAVYFDDLFKSRLPEVYAQGGEVSTTDFIRNREKGSPPEGEVPTDEYIQQMFTGTPPADRTTNPGLLPPELRQAIDVPLDLANTFIRSAAGAVAGPVYGLYKGITSDKFGTPEGVQEASSEAGRMMQKITGTPKTQTGRDVMEFIGEKAEALKLAPTPQLLTAPLPGPASASALLRSYELAETPPVGAINVPGAKAQVTPPKNEMGFFSPTEQVVMNLPQEKGTAQQMLAQISKAPGAKAAELRATGLEEFLKSKGTAPVTRQEIQDYLASNRVQVDEVVLGRGQTLSPEAKRLSDEAMLRMEEIDDKLAKYFEGVESVAGQDPYSLFVRLRGPVGRKAAKGDQDALDELNALNLPPEIRDLVLEFGRNKNEYVKYTGQARRMEKPRFDRYNIPGGTNAREIYLTLPLKRTTEAEARSIVGDETWNRMTPEQRQELMSYPTEAAKQNQFTVSSAHSVSPEADRNRLAHIFLDDRTDAEGNKVLFVQELQSDWAQQGRDKGFFDKTRLDFLDAQLKRQGKLSPEEAAEYNRLTDMENLPISTGTVFPAPFVSTQQYQVMKEGKPLVTKNKKDQDVLHIYSSPEDAQRAAERFGGTVKDIGMQENTEGWVNLALKRVIKDAVDNGYDKVAFIKGEQAAKKYGLSTVLDGIEVSPSQLKNFTFLSPNSPRLVELKQKSGGIIPLFVNQKGVVEAVDNDFYRQFIGKPLPEIVGKEMSEKIMTATLKPGGESSVNFDVKDMEVGGQGMKGFYDNILPKTANKLLSKLGSKIEPVEVVEAVPSQMPFQAYAARGDSFLDWMQQNHPEVSQADAVRAWGMGVDNNQFVKDFYESTKADQYLGFKITPEMADMVKTQGLPQFAAGGEVTKFIKAHA